MLGYMAAAVRMHSVIAGWPYLWRLLHWCTIFRLHVPPIVTPKSCLLRCSTGGNLLHGKAFLWYHIWPLGQRTPRLHRRYTIESLHSMRSATMVMETRSLIDTAAISKRSRSFR